MNAIKRIFDNKLAVIGSVTMFMVGGLNLHAMPANPTLKMKLKNALGIPVKISKPANVKKTPNKFKSDFKSANARHKGVHPLVKTPMRVTPEARARAGAPVGTDQGFIRKPGLLGAPNKNQFTPSALRSRAGRHEAAAAKVKAAPRRASLPARKP